MPPTFIGVHLTVADIVASASFYRQIGPSLPDAPDLGEHVEIELGDSFHLTLSTERVTRMYDPDGNIVGFHSPTDPSKRS
jgi:hypothetical protein